MTQTGKPQLYIPRALQRVMLAHGQAEYPLEACGLLGGRNGRIHHLYAVENILHSPTRYEMDPLQQIQAILHIENQGDGILAIYHTHPHGPETPSPTDITLVTFPDAVYIIISLADRTAPTLRGFRITQGQVREVRLRFHENSLPQSN